MDKTEINLEHIAEDEETVRISMKRAAARRKRREELRRRKRNRNIAVCICCSLVLITICVILLFALTKKSEPASVADVKEEVTSKSKTAEKKAKNNEVIPPLDEPEVIENEFASIYYYEEANMDRYEAYRQENPDMSADDIVWRVNANLDKPWYEYDITVDSYDDPYIIVNKYYTVPEGYRPPDLVNIDGYEMREETGAAYREMKAEAAKEGIKIRVVSAYRSVEYQRGLYNRYLSGDSKENVDRYSARPGHSEHHTGMALDLFGSSDGLRNFINTPEGPWVRENCYKYGFIVRYTTELEGITGYEDEPWHIRYVGKEVSMDMKEKGIASFEEYHVKYIEHSPDEG